MQGTSERADFHNSHCVAYTGQETDPDWGASYLEKTQGELVEGWRSTMMASEDDYCWRRSLPSKRLIESQTHYFEKSGNYES